ncbi:MAG: nucleotide exchange factor GrpE [Actinomycetes bacterium]
MSDQLADEAPATPPDAPDASGGAADEPTPQADPQAGAPADPPAATPAATPADGGADSSEVEATSQAPREDDEPTAGADEPDWAVLAAEDPRSREELLAELTAAEADRDAYLDDLRRARAEFENYRKRMLREQAAMRSAGTADLAGRLLEVLDDFDRTLDAAEASEDQGLGKGVTMVHGKLVEVLQAAGLTRIDQAGVPFDPQRHEAVQQVAADEPVDEPTVAQVLRPGYELGGRVLRAAMVSVAQ